MKKVFAFILTVTVALSMTACAAKETASAESSVSTSEVTSVSKETVSVSSVETVIEEPVEESVQEGLVTEAPEDYEYSVVITINPQITLYVTYDENGEAVVNSFKFDNDDATLILPKIPIMQLNYISSLKKSRFMPL